MAIRLNEDQRAEFERQLTQDGLSEQEAQQAVEEGARMAQADMEQGDDAQRLAEYGFGSVDELLEAYERVQGTVSELRGMLSRLLDIRRAEQTASELEMHSPDYELRRRIETELRPMRERSEQEVRNRLIQKDWQDSAAQMAGLDRLLPEVAEYIMNNPRYAQESDGLRRAYDAVRSGKYREEEELLLDPEFIQRAAGNEKVREAVMRACLEQIRRSGGGVAQSVGASEGSGKSPMTGRKNITGMQQAKKRLEAMLGVQSDN